MTEDPIRRVFAALDYERLGAIYCDEGGAAFWRARRADAVRLGRRWAHELSARVPRGGASLYVGAGVAEIPAMVTEIEELGRRVVAVNLRAAECEVVNAALAAAGLAERLRVEAADVRSVTGREPGVRFDHAALVSVLTDPETFPTLAAVAYGRVPPVQLDLDAFAAERERGLALVEAIGGALALPATVTTSVEEVAWLCDWASRHGVEVVADDTTVETAIVGDPIGFLRLERR